MAKTLSFIRNNNVVATKKGNGYIYKPLLTVEKIIDPGTLLLKDPNNNTSIIKVLGLFSLNASSKLAKLKHIDEDAANKYAKTLLVGKKVVIQRIRSINVDLISKRYETGVLYISHANKSGTVTLKTYAVEMLKKGYGFFYDPIYLDLLEDNIPGTTVNLGFLHLNAERKAQKAKLGTWSIESKLTLPHKLAINKIGKRIRVKDNVDGTKIGFSAFDNLTAKIISSKDSKLEDITNAKPSRLYSNTTLGKAMSIMSGKFFPLKNSQEIIEDIAYGRESRSAIMIGPLWGGIPTAEQQAAGIGTKVHPSMIRQMKKEGDITKIFSANMMRIAVGDNPPFEGIQISFVIEPEGIESFVVPLLSMLRINPIVPIRNIYLNRFLRPIFSNKDYYYDSFGNIEGLVKGLDNVPESDKKRVENEVVENNRTIIDYVYLNVPIYVAVQNMELKSLEDSKGSYEFSLYIHPTHMEDNIGRLPKYIKTIDDAFKVHDIRISLTDKHDSLKAIQDIAKQFGDKNVITLLKNRDKSLVSQKSINEDLTGTHLVLKNKRLIHVPHSLKPNQVMSRSHKLKTKITNLIVYKPSLGPKLNLRFVKRHLRLANITNKKNVVDFSISNGLMPLPATSSSILGRTTFGNITDYVGGTENRIQTTTITKDNITAEWTFSSYGKSAGWKNIYSLFYTNTRPLYAYPSTFKNYPEDGIIGLDEHPIIKPFDLFLTNPIGVDTSGKVPITNFDLEFAISDGLPIVLANSSKNRYGLSVITDRLYLKGNFNAFKKRASIVESDATEGNYSVVTTDTEFHPEITSINMYYPKIDIKKGTQYSKKNLETRKKTGRAATLKFYNSSKKNISFLALDEDGDKLLSGFTQSRSISKMAAFEDSEIWTGYNPQSKAIVSDISIMKNDGSSYKIDITQLLVSNKKTIIAIGVVKKRSKQIPFIIKSNKYMYKIANVLYDLVAGPIIESEGFDPNVLTKNALKAPASSPQEVKENNLRKEEEKNKKKEKERQATIASTKEQNIQAKAELSLYISSILNTDVSKEDLIGELGIDTKQDNLFNLAQITKVVSSGPGTPYPDECEALVFSMMYQSGYITNTNIKYSMSFMASSENRIKYDPTDSRITDETKMIVRKTEEPRAPRNPKENIIAEIKAMEDITKDVTKVEDLNTKANTKLQQIADDTGQSFSTVVSDDRSWILAYQGLILDLIGGTILMRYVMKAAETIGDNVLSTLVVDGDNINGDSKVVASVKKLANVLSREYRTPLNSIVRELKKRKSTSKLKTLLRNSKRVETLLDKMKEKITTQNSKGQYKFLDPDKVQKIANYAGVKPRTVENSLSRQLSILFKMFHQLSKMVLYSEKSDLFIFPSFGNNNLNVAGTTTSMDINITGTLPRDLVKVSNNIKSFMSVSEAIKYVGDDITNFDKTHNLEITGATTGIFVSEEYGISSPIYASGNKKPKYQVTSGHISSVMLDITTHLEDMFLASTFKGQSDDPFINPTGADAIYNLIKEPGTVRTVANMLKAGRSIERAATLFTKGSTTYLSAVNETKELSRKFRLVRNIASAAYEGASIRQIFNTPTPDLKVDEPLLRALGLRDMVAKSVDISTSPQELSWNLRLLMVVEDPSYTVRTNLKKVNRSVNPTELGNVGSFLNAAYPSDDFESKISRKEEDKTISAGSSANTSDSSASYIKTSVARISIDYIFSTMVAVYVMAKLQTKLSRASSVAENEVAYESYNKLEGIETDIILQNSIDEYMRITLDEDLSDNPMKNWKFGGTIPTGYTTISETGQDLESMYLIGVVGSSLAPIGGTILKKVTKKTISNGTAKMALKGGSFIGKVAGHTAVYAGVIGIIQELSAINDRVKIDSIIPNDSQPIVSNISQSYHKNAIEFLRALSIATSKNELVDFIKKISDEATLLIESTGPPIIFSNPSGEGAQAIAEEGEGKYGYFVASTLLGTPTPSGKTKASVIIANSIEKDKAKSLAEGTTEIIQQYRNNIAGTPTTPVDICGEELLVLLNESFRAITLTSIGSIHSSPKMIAENPDLYANAVKTVFGRLRLDRFAVGLKSRGYSNIYSAMFTSMIGLYATNTSYLSRVFGLRNHNNTLRYSSIGLNRQHRILAKNLYKKDKKSLLYIGKMEQCPVDSISIWADKVSSLMLAFQEEKQELATDGVSAISISNIIEQNNAITKQLHTIANDLYNNGLTIHQQRTVGRPPPLHYKGRTKKIPKFEYSFYRIAAWGFSALFATLHGVNAIKFLKSTPYGRFSKGFDKYLASQYSKEFNVPLEIAEKKVIADSNKDLYSTDESLRKLLETSCTEIALYDTDSGEGKSILYNEYTKFLDSCNHIMNLEMGDETTGQIIGRLSGSASLSVTETLMYTDLPSALLTNLVYDSGQGTIPKQNENIKYNFPSIGEYGGVAIASEQIARQSNVGTSTTRRIPIKFKGINVIEYDNSYYNRLFNRKGSSTDQSNIGTGDGTFWNAAYFPSNSKVEEMLTGNNSSQIAANIQKYITNTLNVKIEGSFQEVSMSILHSMPLSAPINTDNKKVITGFQNTTVAHATLRSMFGSGVVPWYVPKILAVPLSNATNSTEKKNASFSIILVSSLMNYRSVSFFLVQASLSTSTVRFGTNVLKRIVNANLPGQNDPFTITGSQLFISISIAITIVNTILAVTNSVTSGALIGLASGATSATIGGLITGGIGTLGTIFLVVIVIILVIGVSLFIYHQRNVIGAMFLPNSSLERVGNSIGGIKVIIISVAMKGLSSVVESITESDLNTLETYVNSKGVIEYIGPPKEIDSLLNSGFLLNDTLAYTQLPTIIKKGTQTIKEVLPPGGYFQPPIDRFNERGSKLSTLKAMSDLAFSDSLEKIPSDIQAMLKLGNNLDSTRQFINSQLSQNEEFGSLYNFVNKLRKFKYGKASKGKVRQISEKDINLNDLRDGIKLLLSWFFYNGRPENDKPSYIEAAISSMEKISLSKSDLFSIRSTSKTKENYFSIMDIAETVELKLEDSFFTSTDLKRIHAILFPITVGNTIRLNNATTLIKTDKLYRFVHEQRDNTSGLSGIHIRHLSKDKALTTDSISENAVKENIKLIKDIVLTEPVKHINVSVKDKYSYDAFLVNNDDISKFSDNSYTYLFTKKLTTKQGEGLVSFANNIKSIIGLINTNISDASNTILPYNIPIENEKVMFLPLLMYQYALDRNKEEYALPTTKDLVSLLTDLMGFLGHIGKMIPAVKGSLSDYRLPAGKTWLFPNDGENITYLQDIEDLSDLKLTDTTRDIEISNMQFAATLAFSSKSISSKIETYSSNHSVLEQGVIAKHRRALKNILMAPLKTYPSIKMYFIEQDRGFITMYDDIYAYGDIISAEIVESWKTPGSTGIVVIADNEYKLDNILTSRLRSENPFELRANGEDNLSGLLLKAGTPFAIYMGYGGVMTEENKFLLEIESVDKSKDNMITLMSRGPGWILNTPINKGFNGKEVAIRRDKLGSVLGLNGDNIDLDKITNSEYTLAKILILYGLKVVGKLDEYSRLGTSISTGFEQSIETFNFDNDTAISSDIKKIKKALKHWTYKNMLGDDIKGISSISTSASITLDTILEQSTTFSRNILLSPFSYTSYVFSDKIINFTTGLFWSNQSAVWKISSETTWEFIKSVLLNINNGRVFVRSYGMRGSLIIGSTTESYSLYPTKSISSVMIQRLEQNIIRKLEIITDKEGNVPVFEQFVNILGGALSNEKDSRYKQELTAAIATTTTGAIALNTNIDLDKTLFFGINSTAFGPINQDNISGLFELKRILTNDKTIFTKWWNNLSLLVNNVELVEDNANIFSIKKRTSTYNLANGSKGIIPDSIQMVSRQIINNIPSPLLNISGKILMPIQYSFNGKLVKVYVTENSLTSIAGNVGIVNRLRVKNNVPKYLINALSLSLRGRPFDGMEDKMFDKNKQDEVILASLATGIGSTFAGRVSRLAMLAPEKREIRRTHDKFAKTDIIHNAITTMLGYNELRLLFEPTDASGFSARLGTIGDVLRFAGNLTNNLDPLYDNESSGDLTSLSHLDFKVVPEKIALARDYNGKMLITGLINPTAFPLMLSSSPLRGIIRQGLESLAEMIRDWYDGWLHIYGDSDVRPMDGVFIYDDITDMYGEVDVKAVVYKFSNTGYISSIRPSTVVSTTPFDEDEGIDSWQGIVYGILGVAMLIAGAAFLKRKVIPRILSKTNIYKSGNRYLAIMEKHISSAISKVDEKFKGRYSTVFDAAEASGASKAASFAMAANAQTFGWVSRFLLGKAMAGTWKFSKGVLNNMLKKAASVEIERSAKEFLKKNSGKIEEVIADSFKKNKKEQLLKADVLHEFNLLFKKADDTLRKHLNSILIPKNDTGIVELDKLIEDVISQLHQTSYKRISRNIKAATKNNKSIPLDTKSFNKFINKLEIEKEISFELRKSQKEIEGLLLERGRLHSLIELDKGRKIGGISRNILKPMKEDFLVELDNLSKIPTAFTNTDISNKMFYELIMGNQVNLLKNKEYSNAIVLTLKEVTKGTKVKDGNKGIIEFLKETATTTKVIEISKKSKKSLAGLNAPANSITSSIDNYIKDLTSILKPGESASNESLERAIKELTVKLFKSENQFGKKIIRSTSKKVKGIFNKKGKTTAKEVVEEIGTKFSKVEAREEAIKILKTRLEHYRTQTEDITEMGNRIFVNDVQNLLYDIAGSKNVKGNEFLKDIRGMDLKNLQTLSSSLSDIKSELLKQSIAADRVSMGFGTVISTYFAYSSIHSIINTVMDGYVMRLVDQGVATSLKTSFLVYKGEPYISNIEILTKSDGVSLGLSTTSIMNARLFSPQNAIEYVADSYRSYITSLSESYSSEVAGSSIQFIPTRVEYGGIIRDTLGFIPNGDTTSGFEQFSGFEDDITKTVVSRLTSPIGYRGNPTEYIEGTIPFGLYAVLGERQSDTIHLGTDFIGAKSKVGGYKTKVVTDLKKNITNTSVHSILSGIVVSVTSPKFMWLPDDLPGGPVRNIFDPLLHERTKNGISHRKIAAKFKAQVLKKLKRNLTFDGNYITIRYKGSILKDLNLPHKNSYMTANYVHLSKIDVKKSDIIKKGTIIGALGGSSIAAWPHLHLQFQESFVFTTNKGNFIGGHGTIYYNTAKLLEQNGMLKSYDNQAKGANEPKVSTENKVSVGSYFKSIRTKIHKANYVKPKYKANLYNSEYDAIVWLVSKNNSISIPLMIGGKNTNIFNNTTIATVLDSSGSEKKVSKSKNRFETIEKAFEYYKLI